MNANEPLTDQLRLASTLTAARLARQRVTAACEGVDGGEAAVAVLLTSELVTNAVLHPGPAADGVTPEIVVEIHRKDGVLRVEVFDHDPSPLPPPRPLTSPSESGTGLYLVAHLASGWGSYEPASGEGKVVWFEIAVHPPGHAPGPSGASIRGDAASGSV